MATHGSKDYRYSLHCSHPRAQSTVFPRYSGTPFAPAQGYRYPEHYNWEAERYDREEERFSRATAFRTGEWSFPPPAGFPFFLHAPNLQTDSPYGPYAFPSFADKTAGPYHYRYDKVSRFMFGLSSSALIDTAAGFVTRPCFSGLPPAPVISGNTITFPGSHSRFPEWITDQLREDSTLNFWHNDVGLGCEKTGSSYVFFGNFRKGDVIKLRYYGVMPVYGTEVDFYDTTNYIYHYRTAGAAVIEFGLSPLRAMDSGYMTGFPETRLASVNRSWFLYLSRWPDRFFQSDEEFADLRGDHDRVVATEAARYYSLYPGAATGNGISSREDMLKIPAIYGPWMYDANTDISLDVLYPPFCNGSFSPGNTGVLPDGSLSIGYRAPGHVFVGRHVPSPANPYEAVPMPPEGWSSVGSETACTFTFEKDMPKGKLTPLYIHIFHNGGSVSLELERHPQEGGRSTGTEGPCSWYSRLARLDAPTCAA